MVATLSRRTFLATGCCLAAAPLVTSATFAAMPGEKRLVTIMLRGAMDGLFLLQPYADPNLRTLRPSLAFMPGDSLIDLDGHYGLNAMVADLLPLWQSGELAFVQSVSTPYRDGRSHFDGQDMLESGGAFVNNEKTGWLNRALDSIPKSGKRLAVDVSRSSELILSGPNDVDVWSPSSNLRGKEDEIAAITALYKPDQAFSAAFAEAMNADSAVDAIYGDERSPTEAIEVATFAAAMLNREYRIANFSISGWDTHADQQRAFRRPAKELVSAVLTLKRELGPKNWANTAVLVMTEFGRAVRQNGSLGTDHGTGGLAMIIGGDVKGGRVIGNWSGLKDEDLLDGRDLAPSGDIRELAAAMLYRQFSVAPGDLNNKIFPGLDFSKSSTYLV